MSKRNAHITHRERLLDAFFKVDEITVNMISSQGEPMEVKRLVFERGHAASALLYDPVRDFVVLISEMRPGILSAGDPNPYSLSIVAGMCDGGDDNLKTIKRETLEESGIVIGRIFEIHPGAYVSPGGTSERIGIYCGLVDSSHAKPFAGLAAEGEDIQTHVISYAAFMAMIDNFEINDLKTVAAGYWLRGNHSRLRKLSANPQQELSA